MEPVIDHIHLTVDDLGRAEQFYDALLPLLGFDLALKERDSEPEDDGYAIVEYHHRSFSLGIVSRRPGSEALRPDNRRPGALHHLAFHVDGRAQVDELYQAVRRLDAEILYPPRNYPEYCADYCAFFFYDSEGIEYEIVSFDRKNAF